MPSFLEWEKPAEVWGSTLPTWFSLSQDAFRAFHLDLDFVGKFLKPLLIGELAPEEPSLDRGKSVSVTCNVDGGGMRLDGRVGGVLPRIPLSGLRQESL